MAPLIALGLYRQMSDRDGAQPVRTVHGDLSSHRHVTVMWIRVANARTKAGKDAQEGRVVHTNDSGDGDLHV